MSSSTAVVRNVPNAASLRPRRTWSDWATSCEKCADRCARSSARPRVLDSYSDVEAELRDTRHALFSSRLRHFEHRRKELELAIDESAVHERELRHELVTLDAQATTAAAEMASRREEVLASALGTLQGLGERARGTSSVIQERDRALRQALIASADENVIATLEADAARLSSDLELLRSEELSLGALREELSESRERLAAAAELVDGLGTTTFEQDEAALRSVREQIGLVERSFTSVQDGERRARARLDDAGNRLSALSASRRLAQDGSRTL